jgi:hypothetical protein
MGTQSTFERLPGEWSRCTEHQVTQKQQARKHESTKSKKGENMIRLEQRLDDALEHLIHTTIGCCISVHRALGPGLLEASTERQSASNSVRAASLLRPRR